MAKKHDVKVQQLERCSPKRGKEEIFSFFFLGSTHKKQTFHGEISEEGT